MATLCDHACSNGDRCALTKGHDGFHAGGLGIWPQESPAPASDYRRWCGRAHRHLGICTLDKGHAGVHGNAVSTWPQGSPNIVGHLAADPPTHTLQVELSPEANALLARAGELVAENEQLRAELAALRAGIEALAERHEAASDAAGSLPLAARVLTPAEQLARVADLKADAERATERLARARAVLVGGVCAAGAASVSTLPEGA
jgi:regulator of replication initiation timing